MNTGEDHRTKLLKEKLLHLHFAMLKIFASLEPDPNRPSGVINLYTWNVKLIGRYDVHQVLLAC